jgi:hypothetical protein
MAGSRPHAAVIGFSSHTGWAAAVAVAGPLDAPNIAAKGRVTMATTFAAGGVFHMAQGLPLAEAEALIRESEERLPGAARDAIAACGASLRDRGLEPVASAVLAGGAARPLPPVEAILRSHPLVHAAEGELYRRVITRASEACDLPVAVVPARDLPIRVAGATRLSSKRVLSILAEIGKASGKPWTKDQKEAALAAWLTLATTRRAAPSDLVG